MGKHMLSFKLGNIKYIFFCLVFLIGIFSRPVPGVAGSVPEDLLYSDDAMLFFGEIKSADDGAITVIQVQKIKGSFEENAELTYDECWLENPEVGKVYLCGYFDEHNPLYLWETDSRDIGAITILQDDEMAQRLQQYLNEGRFAEEEAARMVRMEQKALVEAEREARYHEWETVSNITRRLGEEQPTAIAVSAISADSSAAVFGSEKLSAIPAVLAGAGGILAVVVSLILIRRKRKK